MVKKLKPEELEAKALKAAEMSREAMQQMYDFLIKERNQNDKMATLAAEWEILPMWILLPDEKEK